MSNDENMDFFDIHEHTRFQITISKPEKVEELSDLFVTRDELRDIIGDRFFYHGTGQRTFRLTSVVESEVKVLTDKLDASGKKTLRIEDQELLDVLKSGYLSDYTPGCDLYGRHGDRICYARRYKRKKLKATQGDVSTLWSCMMHAFRVKYGCYPSHIPRYDRHIPMFNAWKKIVGWRRTRRQMSNPDNVKFYRQIWDDPEEFIK